MSQNVRIDLSYKGTSFRGFAENNGVRTVAGVLRSALEQVLGGSIPLNVAGRTDAGVHALRQVVSFRTANKKLDPSKLQRSLNRLCAPDISVQNVSVVPESFDARFSAVRRGYMYTINNSSVSDPLKQDLEWHVRQALNVEAMNAAAKKFEGDHDFTSFCRRRKDKPDATMNRSVYEANWQKVEENRLSFSISAAAFCHQMVRSIVGFCVAIGMGDRAPEDVITTLEAKDRSIATLIAPSKGLTLVEVSYVL